MFRDFEIDRIRTKADLINWLAWQAGYKSYLEVATPTTGHQFGLISRQVFTDVHRVMYRLPAGYDDGMEIAYRTSSDDSGECFRALQEQHRRFDLIFVDAAHTYECSRRDLEFALELMNPHGTLVVHDCHPTTPEVAAPQLREGVWSGVTYLAFLDLVRERPELDYCVVDFDMGCGVVRRRETTLEKDAIRPAPAVWTASFRSGVPGHDYRDWPTYMANRSQILNLVSVPEFLRRYRVRPLGFTARFYHRFAPAIEATGILDKTARLLGRARRQSVLRRFSDLTASWPWRRGRHDPAPRE